MRAGFGAAVALWALRLQLHSDCNGNLRTRPEATGTNTHSYDADGGRVRKESQTEVTCVISPHYEAVISAASG